MTTTFSMTTAEVIQEALENIGVFGEGATVTSAQTARGLKAINMHLKLWSSQGLDGFIRKTQSVSLVDGTASYTLSPRPTDVVGVYLRDSDSEDSPIMELTKEQYEAISDKDAEGEPSAFWCDLGTVGTVTLYTWPVMNASGYSLRVDYRRPLEDVASGDTIDIGQEWLLALVAAVENYLAPKYGKKADPQKAGSFYGAAYGVTKQLPPNPLIGWPGESLMPKLPLIGVSGRGRSYTQNARRALNITLESDDAGGKGKIIWLGRPGLASFGTPSAAVRGHPILFGDYFYYVAGSGLYRMNSAGTESSSLGTLGSSSGNVSMTRNRTQILIADGTQALYVYYVLANNGVSAGTFTTVSSFSTVLAITDITQTEAAGTSVTHVGASTTYTVAAVNHGFVAGNTATIAGTTNFNGAKTVVTAATSSFTFTHTNGTDANETVALTITGEVYTAVVEHGLTAADVGSEVLFSGTTNFNGIKTLTAIPSIYNFRFTHDNATDADEEDLTSAEAAVRADDLTISPAHVTHMSGYGLANNTRMDTDDGVHPGQFYPTDPDDFSTIDVTDYLVAQRDPDALKVLYALGGDLHLFGEISLEHYYYAGAVDSPFQPTQSAATPWGIAAEWTVAKCGDGVAWVAQRDNGALTVCVMEGYIPREIASHAVAYRLAQASTAEIAAATAFSYRQEAHDIYVLTFASETWAYDYTESQKVGQPVWTEWGSSSSKFLGKWYVYAFGKQLVTNHSSAAIYELDLDTNTDAGSSIQRLGVSGYVHADDKGVTHNRVCVLLETGITLTLESSDDSGTTWTSHGTRTGRRQEWFGLGLVRTDRLYRISTTTNDAFVVTDAYVDVDTAEH